ncbi:hypothetical protein F5Y00DRAFT_250813 [Daldinia vernicosa]|uniref:uncharacterized protein n=1 Tax=Daldinia vernicosa TaxID=114800 RepID=UPI002007BA86|nr:uncharacterized protein F5Y00DRAFT_250813 [Daldinia vernicosa]KAI0853649.1 hypothetical protein F5Y00DRAFT_250813 [Daldinia vernicosa]
MASIDIGRKKVEKRNRPPVSCEPCRTRKLKCNRGSPCDSCIRRDKASLCNYAANASRSEPSNNRPRDLKDRLNTLENLVSSLLSGDAVVQPGLTTRRELFTKDAEDIISPARPCNKPTDHDSGFTSQNAGEDALTPETPHLQETADGQVNYIDPSHWLSILDDIKEVREHLLASNHPTSQNEKGFTADRVVLDASFLLSSNQVSSLDEILSSLPSQPICDMLLSWYFGSRFMVLGIIHPDKFQSEYASFWESPFTTPPLWVALLFSVLSVSVSLRKVSNIREPEGLIPHISILQQRALQCLVLGRYATANAHALEAFILHIQSCFFSNEGNPVDLWFEMGTIIRLAFRMGYHRDPNNLTGISAFDGEMRRRVWVNIFQIDALVSFQMGFPSMIPNEFCDTEVPRNLEYSDLHVDMTVLPPSRPLSENTHILYTIVKASVMGVFKKIVANTQSILVPAYDETIRLDAEMNQVYSMVPELLKRRDVNRSFIDHPCLIWQRCTIEMLYLKGLIVLHRRYISYELRSPRFEQSRHACVEAALDIVSRQIDIHQACEPGGRLYGDRWMFCSLSVHDLLLASMVLCLDLSVRMRSRSGVLTERRDTQQLASREYRALQESQRIWADSKAASPDAQTAALALDLMIKKVAQNDVGLSLAEETISSGVTNPIIDSELPYAATMSQMIDGSESIDWSLLDQYLQY